MKRSLIFAALLLPLGALAAECSLDKGRQTFANKCGICHVAGAGEAASVGPNLYGVVGRAVGKAANFTYSEALTAAGGIWDEARLDAFLKSPQQAVPGTAMPFQGLKSEAERRQLICFLQTLK